MASHIVERAREAHQALAAERHVAEEARRAATKEQLAAYAGEVLLEWSQEHRVESGWVLGDVELTPGGGGRVQARFPGEVDDPDPDLTLTVVIGGPNSGEYVGDALNLPMWRFEVDAPCIECGGTHPRAAGHTLADIGRVLDTEYECPSPKRPSPMVVVSALPVWGEAVDAGDQLAWLESEGYETETIVCPPAEGGLASLVIIARRRHAEPADQPF